MLPARRQGWQAASRSRHDAADCRQVVPQQIKLRSATVDPVADFFYGVSRLINAGVLSLPLRSTAETATSSGPPITGRGIIRNRCTPGMTSVVQLLPTRVRTTQSQTASGPCGWIDTVLDAELGSRPTRTTGAIGGVLSIQVDAGTRAFSAYGP